MILNCLFSVVSRAGLVAIILTGCANSAAAAEAIPEPDIDAFGGVLFFSWTSRSWEGHTSMVSLAAMARARDIHYLVKVTSGDETETLAEGDLKNLRKGDYQILTSQKQEIGDNAIITSCLNYYNIDEKKHFASVSQFEELAIVGNGGSDNVAGPLFEWVAPVRLVHDGNLTCDLLMEPATLTDLQAKFDPSALVTSDASQGIERSENPDNANTISLSSWLIGKKLHVLEGMISPSSDIAQVEYRVRIAQPADAKTPDQWSGQIPFISRNTSVDFTVASSDGNEGKRLPAQSVTLDTCLSYFDVAERRYARETWQGTSDFDKVVQFADTTLPQTIFADGDIVIETATSPLGCDE